MQSQKLRPVPDDEALATKQQHGDQEREFTKFIRWLLPRWDQFTALFDAHGTLDYANFDKYVRQHGRYTGDSDAVFRFLERDASGHVNLRVFLDLKRAYQGYHDIQQIGVDGLKRLMATKYGSLGKAWRVTFDKENVGRCSFKAFVNTCKEHGFKDNVLSTWVDLTGGDVHANITLKEWDPSVHELLLALTKVLVARHGSVREGWAALMKSGIGKTGSIKLEEWIGICKGCGVTAKGAEKTFKCLDLKTDKMVSKDEVFLTRIWEDEHPEGKERLEVKRPMFSPLARAYEGPGVRLKQKPGTGGRIPQARQEVLDAVEQSMSGSIDGSTNRSGRAPVPVEGKKNFEFTVVLTKAEYEEYLKRRREKQIMRGSLAEVPKAWGK